MLRWCVLLCDVMLFAVLYFGVWCIGHKPEPAIICILTLSLYFVSVHSIGGRCAMRHALLVTLPCTGRWRLRASSSNAILSLRHLSTWHDASSSELV